MDITDNTIKQINKCIKEQNKLNPEKNSEYIKSSGKQQVNGNQALTYCRIRNTGNSDFDRVKRQKLVLSAIYNKVKNNSSIFSYMQICKKIFPKIQTSMQWQDLIPLAITYIKSSSQPESYALTDTSYLKAGYLNGGVFYLIPNTLENAAKDLHKKIYGDTNYSVSPKLKELSNEMTLRLKGTQILDLSTDTTI